VTSGNVHDAKLMGRRTGKVSKFQPRERKGNRAAGDHGAEAREGRPSSTDNWDTQFRLSQIAAAQKARGPHLALTNKCTPHENKHYQP
jgi:hypothetical protein